MRLLDLVERPGVRAGTFFLRDELQVFHAENAEPVDDHKKKQGDNDFQYLIEQAVVFDLLLRTVVDVITLPKIPEYPGDEGFLI
jgi:hypothetical protein